MEPNGKNKEGMQYRLVVKCIGSGINLFFFLKTGTKKGTAFFCVCGIKTFSELCCLHKTFDMVLTHCV